MRFDELCVSRAAAKAILAGGRVSERCPGASCSMSGFSGGSSMERLPTEVAITESMKRFERTPAPWSRDSDGPPTYHAAAGTKEE
ncbi:MAG TPA: hypothetical protein VLS28_13015 [Candidatus Sulfomarinibacteraceae bacterium]|nr:hypothetical protein [Candidatus Sulfomarinibacteraceae bacterium]